MARVGPAKVTGSVLTLVIQQETPDSAIFNFIESFPNNQDTIGAIFDREELALIPRPLAITGLIFGVSSRFWSNIDVRQPAAIVTAPSLFIRQWLIIVALE